MMVRSFVARGGFAITPNNTTLLTNKAFGIYVGTAGNLTVLTDKDETVTFSDVPAGSIIPIVAKRVNVTGTTASNLVGFRF
jgi:hypothetical protein